MSHLKKFAIGVAMTGLTVAALFFVVKRWFPSVKSYLDINA